jgi:hypothetical protein
MTLTVNLRTVLESIPMIEELVLGANMICIAQY